MIKYFVAEACTCGTCKTADYAPFTERDETPERLIEHLSVAQKQMFDDEMAEYYIGIARHEAGHVVAAAAGGRKTKYVTIGGGAPHVHYMPAAAPQSLLDSMVATIAGAVAERVGAGLHYNPPWSALIGVVLRAREGTAGTCDACHVANSLVRTFPGCSDETLTETWCGLISLTHALFGDDEVRCAMLSLARELHEKTLLEQPRIEDILAGYELAGVIDRALAANDLSETLSAWRIGA